MPRDHRTLPTQKCGKCKGVPRQHNIRQPHIYVPPNVFDQHPFVFTGGQ